jgi:hypothetical protein
MALRLHRSGATEVAPGRCGRKNRLHDRNMLYGKRHDRTQSYPAVLNTTRQRPAIPNKTPRLLGCERKLFGQIALKCKPAVSRTPSAIAGIGAACANGGQ